MKKIVTAAIAVAMLGTISSAAFAANENPTVFVDTSKIIFEDQEPTILGDGFTVVPARGVFEAMGATVDWKEDTRTVNVTSGDGSKLIVLTIDNTEMTVSDTSNALANVLTGTAAPKTSYTLDVPAQIINDRTMIPLRAISEALGADVKWDGEKYEIDITTADAPASKENYPSYKLTSETSEVKEGDVVDVYLNLTNIPTDTFVSGVTATLEYDKDNFEYVSSVLVNGDTTIEGALGAENPDYDKNMLKTAFVNIDTENSAKTDGAIMKFTFKSKNGKGGAFALSNSYDTKLGYNTSLLVDKAGEDDAAKMYEGNDIVIDTTPLVIGESK